MSEHEYCSHELLASMIAEADPTALMDRGHVLISMAPMLSEVGQLIAARMANMEFRGEAADVIRAWGDHFRRESDTLSKYAMSIGEVTRLAGEALSEAKASMPPTRPAPLAPLTGEATPLEQMMAESDRQEAIAVMDRLSSRYRVAAESMAQAQEPRFEPLVIDSKNIEGPTPQQSGGPSTSASPGSSSSTRVPISPDRASVESAVGHGGVSFELPASLVDLGSHQGTVVAPTPAPIDEWIGTSLDSAGPVTDVRVPASPAPGAPGPVLPPVDAGAGGGYPPHRVPPVTLRPGMPGSGESQGRPLTPGLQTPLPTRPPTSSVAPSGANTSPVGRPPAGVSGGSANQGPMAGRPPISGVPGINGGAGRIPGHSGIVGGVPRQALNPVRAIPQGGVIGPGMAPAVRDPSTGAVRGPGGGLIGRPAGYADERRVTGAGNSRLPAGTVIGGARVPAPKRRRKVKRGNREQQGKGH